MTEGADLDDADLWEEVDEEAEGLNTWEADFMESTCDRAKQNRLTQKQRKTLERLWDRHVS